MRERINLKRARGTFELKLPAFVPLSPEPGKPFIFTLSSHSSSGRNVWEKTHLPQLTHSGRMSN